MEVGEEGDYVSSCGKGCFINLIIIIIIIIETSLRAS